MHSLQGSIGSWKKIKWKNVDFTKGFTFMLKFESPFTLFDTKPVKDETSLSSMTLSTLRVCNFQ